MFHVDLMIEILNNKQWVIYSCKWFHFQCLICYCSKMVLHIYYCYNFYPVFMRLKIVISQNPYSLLREHSLKNNNISNRLIVGFNKKWLKKFMVSKVNILKLEKSVISKSDLKGCAFWSLNRVIFPADRSILKNNEIFTL